MRLAYLGVTNAFAMLRLLPTSSQEKDAEILALRHQMNSIMERWVQTCRRELLDRTLVWNKSHLLHALREFEQFYNGHRPHQGIANAPQPLPVPLAAPDQFAGLDIRRRDRLSGVLHEYQHAA